MTAAVCLKCGCLKIGAFIDFGIVLKASLMQQGVVQDPQILGLRNLSKWLIDQHADEPMELLLKRSKVMASMHYLGWLGILPVEPLSSTIFLDWKCRCEKAGGFDVALVRSSLEEMSRSVLKKYLSEAIFLSGIYWGFHEFAMEYHSWRKRKAQVL